MKGSVLFRKPPRNPSPLRMLTLLTLLVCHAGTAAAQSARPAGEPVSGKALRLGERMYREGILPSGKPMQAVAKGDSLVNATTFTCVSCHLRSGLGSFEGGVVTPPANGRNLFKPQYLIYMGVEVTGEAPVRPAYTDESLARALRFGVDPSGRVFSEAMPRYLLGDKDMVLLIDYLKSMSTEFSPGVSDRTVRFATVITDDVSTEDRNAMFAPLERFIATTSTAIATGASRAERDLTGSAEPAAVPSSMHLSLSRWLLKGPPETWRAQLESYYRKEPVFALLGGITNGEWRPIHEFSEDNRIPCILPVTSFPVISEKDWYTLYFSKGLYQEGESAARYVNGLERPTQGGPVVQLVRTSREGLALASGFSKAWQELEHAAPLTATLRKEESLTGKRLQLLLEKERPAVLLVWDGPDALPALQVLAADQYRPQMVFLSSSYAGRGVWTINDGLRDLVFITYPYRLPKGQKRSALGSLAAVQSSSTRTIDVPRDEFIISKKMLAAIRVLSQALLDMKGQYYRDYLLDVIGMSSGSMSMTSVADDETYPLYERLSFGPGQRYASKGCFIVQLTKGPRAEAVRKNDWVTY